MKKIFLFMLALVLSIGCVFAVNGKILVGGNGGYIPELKVAQFDANARWRMDYDSSKNFTADLVCSAGAITDFKAIAGFNCYLGAGLTKEIATGWNVFANAGLDAIFSAAYKTLGVAANAGFEYEITDKINANFNVKLSQYFPGGTYAFKPSLGATYSF